jgi:two-component system chemotaxis sensor kinase CheA
MSIEEAKQTFAQEALELLEEMEDALLSMEEAPDDEEHLNSVFRSMHTIKGAAGVFGFDAIVAFTHPVETVMDALRNGERNIDSELIAILLECKDHTEALVKFAMGSESETITPELQTQGDGLLQRLTGDSIEGGAEIHEDAIDLEKDGSSESVSDNWVISLQFDSDTYRHGLDPLSFIRYLRTLGEIVEIITLSHTMPQANEMDAESCYLGFRIAFNSDANKSAIEDVFEFAQDDCEIRILPPRSKQEHYLELLQELPEWQVSRLGEMLVEIGAVTKQELLACLGEQSQACEGEEDSDANKAKPLGEILVEREVVGKPVVEQALKKQEKTRERGI